MKERIKTKKNWRELMKLQFKEANTDWKTFFEGTKKEVEEAYEWNVRNANNIKSGKEFRIMGT